MLSAWMQRNRRYPDAARNRGEEGVVVVRFTVDRSGQVVSVSLVRGSGHDALDDAAQAMLRGASVPPFPASMPQQQQTITVPIRYRLQG